MEKTDRIKRQVGLVFLLVLFGRAALAQEPVTAVVPQFHYAAEAGGPNAVLFDAPQPQPGAQDIRDYPPKGLWEISLGYAFVRFNSSLFNASTNGLNTSVAYYLRDHLAVEGNITWRSARRARAVLRRDMFSTAPE